jgi:hypothetical protein
MTDRIHHLGKTVLHRLECALQLEEKSQTYTLKTSYLNYGFNQTDLKSSQEGMSYHSPQQLQKSLIT